MALPNPKLVKNDFSKFIQRYEEFVNFLEINDVIEFVDYFSYLSSIRVKLIEIWHNINLLTIVDRKYSKAFEKIRNISIFLTTEPDRIGKKYSQGNLLLGDDWIYEFKKGKLKKELLKFFKKILKDLKKAYKIL